MYQAFNRCFYDHGNISLLIKGIWSLSHCLFLHIYIYVTRYTQTIIKLQQYSRQSCVITDVELISPNQQLVLKPTTYSTKYLFPNSDIHQTCIYILGHVIIKCSCSQVDNFRLTFLRIESSAFSLLKREALVNFTLLKCC